MGDRIAVMNAGRLEQVGTPEELYERPANQFVAAFIGSPSMSLVPLAALPLELPGAPAGAVLGARPEHARLWQEGEGMLGPLDGEVAYVEALGRETFLGVNLKSASPSLESASPALDSPPRFVVSVAGRAAARPRRLRPLRLRGGRPAAVRRGRAGARWGRPRPRGRDSRTGLSGDPTVTLVPPRLYGRAAANRFRPMPAAIAQLPSSVARIAKSSGARSQVGLFLLAYFVYSAARYVMVGDLGAAQAHAEWIVDLEQDFGVATEASVQKALHGHLDAVAPQPRLPRRAARGRPRRADLPLPPLAPGLRPAAQHDPGHLADLRPGLRRLPRRAAAAGRHGPRRHDLRADRLRDGLQPDDRLLQRAGRRAQPARRLRRRRRDRRGVGRAQPAPQDRSRSCGARRSASRSSPPATTSCSTSSPASSPARSATASAPSWRGPVPAARPPLPPRGARPCGRPSPRPESAGRSRARARCRRPSAPCSCRRRKPPGARARPRCR